MSVGIECGSSAIGEAEHFCFNRHSNVSHFRTPANNRPARRGSPLGIGISTFRLAVWACGFVSIVLMFFLILHADIAETEPRDGGDLAGSTENKNSDQGSIAQVGLSSRKPPGDVKRDHDDTGKFRGNKKAQHSKVQNRKFSRETSTAGDPQLGQIPPPDQADRSRHTSSPMNNNFRQEVVSDTSYPAPAAVEIELGRRGEMGEAVVLPGEGDLPSEIRVEVRKGWEEHRYNAFVSGVISVNRSLPDVRMPACKIQDFTADELPSASIIMCFHNEALPTLMRSLHSILNRSPPHLVEEILLVDDSSGKENLNDETLGKYLALLPKVRLIRLRKREGLIRCRLAGAKVARGDVLVFLDSHIEATSGWLEPLLRRVGQSWSNVAVPVIDNIDEDTFKFKAHGHHSAIQIGDFDWALSFHWQLMSLDRVTALPNVTAPIPSPTMAGGLFAISKRFFAHIGGYDAGLDFWGGENMELSFKIWLCGGSLDIMPCSHVGHVFRMTSPIMWPYGGRGDAILRNDVRVARVWLDEYVELFYSEAGNHTRNWDSSVIGDLSSRFALKKRLNCKPFRWYLSEIYPEKFVPYDALARGEIRNLKWISRNGFGNRQFCLDAKGSNNLRTNGTNVHLRPCHRSGGNQNWHFLNTGHIRKEMGGCLHANNNGNTRAEDGLVLKTCADGNPNQRWSYEYQHPAKASCRTNSSKDKGSDVKDVLLDARGSIIQKHG